MPIHLLLSFSAHRSCYKNSFHLHNGASLLEIRYYVQNFDDDTKQIIDSVESTHRSTEDDTTEGAAVSTFSSAIHFFFAR